MAQWHEMMRFDVRDVPTAALAGSEAIRGAYACFVKQGYAVLDNALPAEKVQAIAAEFDRRYSGYYGAAPTGEFMEVGKKRLMIPVELSGVFNDPLLFANPCVLEVLKLALGPDAVIEAFGAFVAMPGAEKQHIHRGRRARASCGISGPTTAARRTFPTARGRCFTPSIRARGTRTRRTTAGVCSADWRSRRI